MSEPTHPHDDSLSPADDRYTQYPTLPIQQHPPRLSRSATTTPTGSPKKRQLPQVPHTTSQSTLRERMMQDFEEQFVTRSANRHQNRQTYFKHQQTYRSTGMGGWERHYAGLSDSDLTMHSLEPRLPAQTSLSPEKDLISDFGDSDLESIVSVSSGAFSTQSEQPCGSKSTR